MIFEETDLQDVYLIKHQEIIDERGFFARSWCANEFKEKKLHHNFVQSSISFNNIKGTLRGMHYQCNPFEEVKIVRCTRGAIFDVVIDIRKNSSTYLKWIGLELNEDNRLMLYIPKGFAHGFVTLLDRSEVFYQISEYYEKDAARGIRYNDPLFNIRWPINASIISEKDTQWPNYRV